MLLTTRKGIEQMLAELESAMREVDDRLSGRFRGLGKLSGVTKRILVCAERLDWLAAEAEPELQQSLGSPPKGWSETLGGICKRSKR
jgi:hypothetical protein